jgi:hypothetical protein
MRPRLRAGCPLLGRCFVLGHCEERHAERRDENGSEKQTGHHVPPQMAARLKAYIRKQAPREIQKAVENGCRLRATRDRSRRAKLSMPILAEMSHQIGFRIEAVARSAHAALPCNITISQNRGNASAREPRTYHGRGFSLLARGIWPEPPGRSRPWPVLIHSKRKILPAEGASTCAIGRARADGAPHRRLPKHAPHARVLPAIKSQRRRQTLLNMTRLEATWEIERKAWR